MKKLILIAAAIGLTACATGPSAYGPATSASSTGFQNTQIENDRFRVSYTGHTPAEAQDYALLRAAEIAVNEGYSHFRIIDGYMSGGERRGSPVSTSVGIGVGSGGYRRHGSYSNFGIGIGINDLGRALNGERIENTIEIKLTNSPGRDRNVYDAQSILDSIRPAVFKE